MPPRAVSYHAYGTVWCNNYCPSEVAGMWVFFAKPSRMMNLIQRPKCDYFGILVCCCFCCCAVIFVCWFFVFMSLCTCIATYSVQVGKVLCEKCLFMNGTSHMTFNQSDLIMWIHGIGRTTQSDIEISYRLFCFFLFWADRRWILVGPKQAAEKQITKEKQSKLAAEQFLISITGNQQ